MSDHVSSPPVSIEGRIEAVTRQTVRGWARDPLRPGHRLLLEAVGHGIVLGSAIADLFRGDVQEADHGDGYCGFVIDISPHSHNLAGVSVGIRCADSHAEVDGSPMPACDPPSVTRFLRRWKDVPQNTLDRLGRRMTSRTEGGVSVIPLGRASLTLLIQSLQEQLCNRWELLLPGGSKTATDSRLRHLAMGRGHAFVDEALAVARYDIVVFVTRNVSLEADSIYWILRHIRQADAELFVWDFLQHNSGSSALEAICRSGFSLDYYLSRPDHGGAYAVRREAARLVGWGKGEVDFTLRLLENGASVAHTPVPLHRVEGSPCEPRPVVLQAIQAHLDRRRTGAKATAAFEGDAYAVSWPPAAGRTLIVIPTFNQADLLNNCVKSILETTPDSIRDVVIIDHRSDDPEARRLLSRLSRSMTVVRYDGEFNFSKMNNLAVRRYGGNAETVLFLNNDTFSLEAGWLERLRSLAIRPDVGAVGALLLYGDRKVQHAGVLLGFDGSATHAHALMAAFRHDGSRLPGYDHHLTTLREVSAVTAACMMMRRAVFDEVRGFDEDLRVGFNDTDLCLRIRGLGYRILQDGQTTLEHYESRTRRLLGGVLHPADTQLFKSRYERTIRKGDPFYNPNLRLDVQDHELRPDCRLQEAPRISHPLPLPSASRDRW